MSLLLLLAEGSDLDKANQAIDTFDKLGKGGPVTLSLVIAFGAIIFAVYMMKKNWKLREDHANELKARLDPPLIARVRVRFRQNRQSAAQAEIRQRGA